MDHGYRLLAAEYIRQQAKQLAGQMAGVRAAEDIEFVHRARVATRRLRAALEMFAECFPPRRIKRWRKAIRRTTASLGDARDRDVQIEHLCEVLAALDDKRCMPGVAAVLVRWERDRRRLQPQVVKAMDRLQSEGILRDMRRRTKKILQGLQTAGQLPQTPETIALVGRHVLRRMNRLLELQDSLADPFDCGGHHALRIALKRLRYTLEISRPLYAERLDEPIQAVKRVQTLLGDVHDCDVWLEHLDDFAAAERQRIVAAFGRSGRFQRLRPGIEFLQDDRRNRRRQAFAELAAFWAELNSRRFWEELASLAGGTDRQSPQY